MVLIWEKVANYIAAEHEGGMPHPATPFYRLKVPGGWLLREEATHGDGIRGPLPALSGPLIFIPDPEHTWEVEPLKKQHTQAIHVAYSE